MNKKSNDDFTIRYVVPWDAESIVERGAVDLIFSQAVMEHVLDLQKAYSTMYSWLKQGGFISHQIDYKAHETHKTWNGHWKYNDALWETIMHGRSYPINRELHSSHVNSILNAGFEIKKIITVPRNDGYPVEELPSQYESISAEDLTTSSAHIIAVK